MGVWAATPPPRREPAGRLQRKIRRLQSKMRPPDAADQVNVRIFLAAHMIVCFPTNFFERIAPCQADAGDVRGHLPRGARREPALGGAAPGSRSMSGRGSCKLSGFFRPQGKIRLAHEVRYLGRFAAWRVPDVARLVGRA